VPTFAQMSVRVRMQPLSGYICIGSALLEGRLLVGCKTLAYLACRALLTTLICGCAPDGSRQV
jgi:hypothetical protein